MFKIIEEPKIVRVTPKMAKAFIDKNNYPGQRARRPKHVDALAKAIKSGDFLVGAIAVAINGDGSEFLANGQHQSHAVIQARKSITAVVTKYHCPTADDAVRLFSLFDNNKSRSLRDTVNVQVSAAKLDWSSKASSTFASALNYMGDDYKILEKARGGSKYDRAREILKHKPLGTLINALIEGKGNSLLHSVPVVQLIIATYYKDPAACEAFWYGVKYGANLSEDDGRLHYRDFLLRAKSKDYNVGPRVFPREFIARGATTWNNYRQGNRRTKVAKYMARKPIPTII